MTAHARLLAIVLALAATSPAGAQGLNLLGQGGGGDGADAQDLLQARSTKRIVIVDNLFFGVSGTKDLRDYFRARGWDAQYVEDTYTSEFFKLAQRTDVLYVVTHAGVRERDQQVGFVWRTLMGANKNTVTADVVAAALRGRPHPALVVVAGCNTTRNDSMARAFGGAYIGFSTEINPATAATWCGDVLRKVADGASYRTAFHQTPLISSWLNPEGGAPRLIEPAPAEE